MAMQQMQLFEAPVKRQRKPAVCSECGEPAGPPKGRLHRCQSCFKLQHDTVTCGGMNEEGDWFCTSCWESKD